MINWVLSIVALVVALTVLGLLLDRLFRNRRPLPLLPLLHRMLILMIGHTITSILFIVVLEPSGPCMLFISGISGGFWNVMCSKKYVGHTPENG